MLILRVRSRDGMERVRVDEKRTTTVYDLKSVIKSSLFPDDQEQEIVALSLRPELLTTKDDVGFCPEGFTDMPDDAKLSDIMGRRPT